MIPAAMHRVEHQEVRRRLWATGDLVDVHELHVRSTPPRAQREPAHAAKPIDADSRHADSALRMTVALDGHAEMNSTEVCTVLGTSARVMRSNPNLGKKPSAVVVRRYNAGAPQSRANRMAASVSA